MSGIILDLSEISDNPHYGVSKEDCARREHNTGYDDWDCESLRDSTGFRVWKCMHRVCTFEDGAYKPASPIWDRKQEYSRTLFSVYDYWDKVPHWLCKQASDGYWEIYYVNKKAESRLVERCYNKPDSKKLILAIHEKEITYSDTIKVDKHMSERKYARVFYEERQKGLQAMQQACEWSRIYQGKTILDLMQDKKKCTFKDAKSVIENELGWIDEKGVIHHRSEKE